MQQEVPHGLAQNRVRLGRCRHHRLGRRRGTLAPVQGRQGHQGGHRAGNQRRRRCHYGPLRAHLRADAPGAGGGRPRAALAHRRCLPPRAQDEIQGRAFRQEAIQGLLPAVRLGAVRGEGPSGRRGERGAPQERRRRAASGPRRPHPSLRPQCRHYARPVRRLDLFVARKRGGTSFGALQHHP